MSRSLIDSVTLQLILAVNCEKNDLTFIYDHIIFTNISQAFGGAGLSSDQPLAQFWSWARVLRLADGPDEVHLGALAKREVKKTMGKDQ